MNTDRTPLPARTRQKARPSLTSASRDRFITRPDFSARESLSPRSLLSQELEVCRQSSSLSLVKVLDAPNVDNDYHLSLLAWSDRDVLIVALRSSLCFYSLVSGAVSVLQSRSNATAVAAQMTTPWAAVGSDRAVVRVIDISTGKAVYEVAAHKDRIAALAWRGDLLLSGSKDCSVRLTDTRTKGRGTVLRAHCGEVCSVAVNQLNSLEVATGAADNRVLVWDLRNNCVRTEGQHRACVKALIWSPWKSDLLISGAGHADSCIKEWSTNGVLMCTQTIDAGAQVSSFLWDRWDRRLISGHGYPSCSISVWEGQKRVEEYPHGGRVLAMAAAPLGDQIATLAADETLRLWRLGAFSSSEEDSLSSRSRRYLQAR